MDIMDLINYEKEVIKALKKTNTISIENLVKNVTEETGGDEKEVEKIIQKMIDENKILKKRSDNASFTEYLKSYEVSWFWFSMIGVMLYIFSTVLSNIITDLIFFRYIFGVLFGLFIPGYVVTKALFMDSQIETVEEIAQSIGLSLMITPLISLLLNFTPLGITYNSVSITLGFISIISGLIGVYRQFDRSRNIQSY